MVNMRISPTGKWSPQLNMSLAYFSAVTRPLEQILNQKEEFTGFVPLAN
jgi:hypothetical protein